MLKMSIGRLVSNSKAVLLLRQKFESGEITVDDDTKSVWLQEAVFKEHNLDNYRTRFNKLEKEILIENEKSYYVYLFI